MAAAEFELIRRYFASQPLRRTSSALGIGDDCALLDIPAGYQLAVTTDTLVENVHFFAHADSRQLGHKALAVNLSDLAAMGAEPIAVTLALTLPAIDHDWLAAFTDGFMALAAQWHVDLIGGDTTAGPLTITVQAMGVVPAGEALRRSGAQVGDLIAVTGPLGDAGLGLKINQGYPCDQPKQALARFNTPQPCLEQGRLLRGVAHACIDISDGLAADLGHILYSSGVGATLHWADLPLSEAVREYIFHTGDWRLPLTAGDDYQLCFTVPAAARDTLPSGCSVIGCIDAAPGLRLERAGRLEPLTPSGYVHFG
jgi:thiamine-monophosphate kinase